MSGGWTQPEWRAGRPYSSDFQDVYFSGDGVDEVEHVFIKATGTPELFAAGGLCRIGELGFGTGLNFLCCLRAFVEHAAADATLEYSTCECSPLSAADIEKSLSHLPDLGDLVGQLVGAYPSVSKGTHSLEFSSGRVRLNLHYGTVEQTLPDFPEGIQAWYLDGFAPDRNPEMWSSTVMERIAEHSADNAVLSTYTAAGVVKKSLRAAGFKVKRVAGYGRKRHMLIARKDA